MEHPSWILAEAVASCWLSHGPDPALAAIEWDLMTALRELDRALPSDLRAAQQQVRRVLGRAAPFGKEVQDKIKRQQPWRLPGRRASKRRRSIVPVVWVTNRKQAGSSRRPWYGPDRQPGLTYGTAEVSVPDYVDDRLAAAGPRRWRMSFDRDGESPPLVAADLEQACRTVAPAGEDLLVFVHGYRVGFDDALKATARLAYDLAFDGVPVLYSWPSRDQYRSYLPDRENAAASFPWFEHFLQQATALVDPGRVHVVAHSMGNQLVTEVLGALAGHRLGHVVFAAPDVDDDVFTHRYKRFRGTSASCTLYASSGDLALWGSKTLSGSTRAGRSKPGPLLLPGLQTVEAVDIRADLFRHSYAFKHRLFLADLVEVLRGGPGTTWRTPGPASPGNHWELRG